MEKLFTSRTFYAALAGVIVNALQAFAPFMSPSLQTAVNLLILILISIFKLNPSQAY